MKLKQNLFYQCEAFVNNRLKTINDIILSNQNALQSETKSSAGDKHETGRAMLQLEMEKASQQLASITQMKTILEKINIADSSNKNSAHLGCIVFTNTANYFLSIASGHITVEHKHYFAISVSSPIGKLLLGKSKNEVIIFNGNTIKILDIQ